MKIISFQDDYIKLSFDVDDMGTVSLELFNDPKLSEIKTSLCKYKAIEDYLNNLVDIEESEEE